MPQNLRYAPCYSISNLSFISEVGLLKKVVASRLMSHIESNCMSNVLLSAYKQFHSTETALLKVHHDITLNMDKGKVTALTLLELSPAFDTIDHNILIKRLSMWLWHIWHSLELDFIIFN